MELFEIGVILCVCKWVKTVLFGFSCLQPYQNVTNGKEKTISIVFDLTSSVLVFSATFASSYSCEFVLFKYGTKLLLIRIKHFNVNGGLRHVLFGILYTMGSGDYRMNLAAILSMVVAVLFPVLGSSTY